MTTKREMATYYRRMAERSEALADEYRRQAEVWQARIRPSEDCGVEEDGLPDLRALLIEALDGWERCADMVHQDHCGHYPGGIEECEPRIGEIRQEIGAEK